MKLLYLANLRMPTEKAYGIQIVKMCEAFSDQSLDVRLVFPYRKNTEIKKDIFSYYSVRNSFRAERLVAPDFNIFGMNSPVVVGIKNFISAIILASYAMFHRADIIYSRDEIVLFFLSFFKKNIIFEAHRFSSKRSFFYGRFNNKGIKIVVISEAIKKDFISHGFNPNKILIAHDGADIKLFDIDVTKNKAREKLDLPEDKKIILYTGHLFEWKGPETLAQAAKSLPDFLFVFVGGTTHDIKIFQNKFGQQTNIKILGHKPYREVPFYLKSADVLVLPNSSKDKISSYTSPLKLFEYMSSKKPIISSALPSIEEILNNNNSILVKPDDSAELARGIKKAIEDGEYSLRLAEQAFKDVQLYSWQKRAQKIINFIS